MAKQTAKTTERSFSIINTIQDLDGATVNELVSELEMAKSTIHIHLRTLIENGYIVKEGEMYHIGLRFLNHGLYARTRKNAYTLAKNTVDQLAKQTSEEVEFVVRNNNRGILVHESFHPSSQYPSKESRISNSDTPAGSYYHLHTVATGKAILAELPNNHVEEIINEWKLPEQTGQTITSKAALLDELEKIRNQGVAFTSEEYVNGLCEVGRRIKNPDGSVLGAIAIVGPKYRFSGDRFTDKLPELLIESVDELEKEIEDSYMNDYL
ncbi:IclR family transcriptional regulator [Natronorubrum aibiense]|uniref:Helix-turn-helix domain-containing protein n=1 Tax=Natronorubrum aibiense TaxID=348826 RepID=A0A5P9P8T5_9EURY|nr:IclR family transcriptional regulator [Natronorubrum aibiense]QFU84533.1 helix-turn-helix domain-containing protein [Natronorubrum aibiense]